MKFYERLHWLRGILSLTVVSSHLGWLIGGHYMPLIRCGLAAVPVFFVLSGFVMLNAVQTAGSGPRAAFGFAARRVLRIFTAYWFFLAATALFVWLGGATWDFAEKPGKAWLADWTLLSFETDPDLPMAVSWSLFYELLFYYVLAIVVLHRRAGLVLLFFYFAGSLVWHRVSPVPIYGFNPFCLLFLAGLVLGLIEQKWPRLLAPWQLVLLAGLGLELVYIGGYANWHNMLQRCAAVLVLAGMLGLELSSPCAMHGAVQKILDLLGTVSFSLYVGHTITQSLLLHLLGRPTILLTAMPFVLTPIAVAFCTFHLIEKPAMGLAKRIAGRKRKSTEGA